jgi:small subunit ribosomal protein S16
MKEFDTTLNLVDFYPSDKVIYPGCKHNGHIPLLVIRLARTGRAKYPTYRLVAADSTKPATGKFVAVLGHYNPHTKELVIKREETVRYLSNGAQPSNTAIKLLMRDGVELPAWVKLKTKAPKAVEAPAEETADEAAPEEASEVTEAEIEADSETETEAPAEEERVASVATDEASDAEVNAPDIDNTDNKAADEE